VFDFRPRIMANISARNSLCRLGASNWARFASSPEDCEGYLEEGEEEASKCTTTVKIRASTPRGFSMKTHKTDQGYLAAKLLIFA
jgi:hypothetical protein